MLKSAKLVNKIMENNSGKGESARGISTSFFDSLKSGNMFDKIRKSFTEKNFGADFHHVQEEIEKHMSSKNLSFSPGHKTEELSLFMKVKKLFDLLKKIYDANADEINKHLTAKNINILSIQYYLEVCESIMTPSERIRRHFFFPSVDKKRIERYLLYGHLSNLVYSPKETKEELNKAIEGMFQKYQDYKNSQSFELFKSIGKQETKVVSFQAVATEALPTHFMLYRKTGSLLEVIVAIRGTYSLEDVLADAAVHHEPFHDGYCHSGIQKQTLNLVQHLEACFPEGFLHRKGLKLTFTGHSLGAAIANASGIWMKTQHPKLDVRVVGFGCPSFLSKNMVKDSAIYCTNIIFDDDIIPRLTEAKALDLGKKVAQHDWTSQFNRDTEALTAHLASKFPLPAAEYVIEQLRKKQSLPDQVEALSLEEKEESVSLPEKYFHPGKLVHIYRAGSGYASADLDAKFFSEITLSRTMVDDHYMENYLRAMAVLIGVEDTSKEYEY